MNGSQDHQIDYRLLGRFLTKALEPEPLHSCALILYFEHDEDRDVFMDLIEDSDPSMVMKPLDRDEMT